LLSKFGQQKLSQKVKSRNDSGWSVMTLCLNINMAH